MQPVFQRGLHVLLAFFLVGLLSLASVVSAQTRTQDPEQDSAAQSDPEAVELQPITVIATRQPRLLTETPANVSTVTRDELDRRMSYTFEDVFRYEPGIEVSRQTTGTDPFSSSGGVEIRGVGGNRTQVLVDGNRTIERFTDSTRDIVDSSNVKAVEIVRGPASVLWGSDGLGGVVNFVTKDPSDYLIPGEAFAGDANISFASLDNAWTESVTGAWRASARTEMLLSYTRRDNEEIELDNARVGPNALQPCPRDPAASLCNEFDPLDSASNNLLGKLVFKLADNNQLRFTGEYFDRTVEVDQTSNLGTETDFFGNPDATLNRSLRTQDTERWRLSVDQRWQPISGVVDSLDWQVTWSPQRIDTFSDQNRTLLPSNEEEIALRDQDTSEEFFEVDIQLTSSFDTGGVDHVLTYGFDGDVVETDRDRVDTTINVTQGTQSERRAGGFNFADAKTTRADLFIQDEIRFADGRFVLVPGARLAYYEIDPDPDADFQLVPGAEPQTIDETDLQLKLGAIVNFNDTYSAYAQVAEGFKMPTAQQLFQSLDSLPFFALIPNPDLQPESVINYEAGFRGDFGATGFFSVNAFYADYEDFILNFVPIDPEQFGLPAGSQTLTYDNVDKVQVFGIEGSGGFNLTEKFSTRFALSYQDGDQEEDGEDSVFLGALPFQIVAGLRYLDRDLGLDLELVGTHQTGGADVNDEDTEFSPGGYTVFDLIAGWNITRNLQLRAGIFNLLDKRYFPAETLGFPINSGANVQRVNPIELQTAPGRNFRLGLSFQF